MDAERCPKGRQSQTTLQQLPQNLIKSIFDQVKQASGLKAIGQLRLVCKAWQACVSHYPAEITCRFNNDSLKLACRILPNMTTISLLDTEYTGIDVGALRNCSYLTAIHLAINSPLGCQDYTEPVQLQDLPASVVSISVDRVLVDSNAYQLMSSAQAAAVKSLQVRSSDYLPGNVWSWLEYLPNVEVLHVGRPSHWWSREFDDLFKRGLGRLTALTNLGFRNGTIGDTVCSQRQCPSMLRELSLFDVAIKRPWISSVFSFTPHLTSLVLAKCTAAGSYPQHLGGLAPLHTLRKLVQRQSSMAFLGLVGTGLLTLDLDVGPDITVQDRQLACAKILSLPRMTSLRLANLRMDPSVHKICGERLRGLRELTLLQCMTTPCSLFQTTAMSSLRVLHIEDELIQWVKENNPRWQQPLPLLKLAASIETAGKSIMGLPALTEISGDSSIFEVGICLKGLLTMRRAPPHVKGMTTRANGSQRPIMIGHKGIAKQNLIRQ